MYPNPAHSSFNIVADNGALVGADYALCDLMGRVTRRGKLLAQNTSVNIVDLSPGIYILHLVNSTDVYKIVKE